MKKYVLLFVVAVSAWGVSAQKVNVYVPGTSDYEILRCDFHIHTVFSDGDVWPTTRVNEAVNEGLDAISLTEHVEYRPKLNEFTSRDHNRSTEIATPAAERADLLFVHGTEVTRSMPPGHLNAIFIDDANVLNKFVDPNDSRNGANIKETLREIKKQGAFVFWNHPNFPGDQPHAILHPIHKELIDEGLIDGIEVINSTSFEPETLGWCRDNNLAVIGTSDVHTTMGLELDNRKLTHRSMTLVLARERTAAAIREALDAHRTVAIMNNKLYGMESNVKRVFEASLDIESKASSTGSAVIEIRNNSSIPYIMEVIDSDGRDGRVTTVDAYSSVRIPVSAKGRGVDIPQTGRKIKVAVKNIFVDADKNMEYEFEY